MNRTIAVLSLVAATAVAQTTAERPRFEIASVQRSGEITNPYTLVSGGVTRGERYELSKATMLDLIRIAWDVDRDVVFGGPNWLEFDRFDITAKVPVGAPPAIVRLMLQSLFTNRFGLVVHKDTPPWPLSFSLRERANQSFRCPTVLATPAAVMFRSPRTRFPSSIPAAM